MVKYNNDKVHAQVHDRVCHGWKIMEKVMEKVMEYVTDGDCHGDCHGRRV